MKKLSYSSYLTQPELLFAVSSDLVKKHSITFEVPSILFHSDKVHARLSGCKYKNGNQIGLGCFKADNQSIRLSNKTSLILRVFSLLEPSILPLIINYVHRKLSMLLAHALIDEG